jgi:hypothetical protein
MRKKNLRITGSHYGLASWRTKFAHYGHQLFAHLGARTFSVNNDFLRITGTKSWASARRKYFTKKVKNKI